MTERRTIYVRGTIQGVGFRPFVHGLASQHRLNGFVRNRSGDVQIDVEGEPASLDAFTHDLVTRPPPLADIVTVSSQQLAIVGHVDFRIEASELDRGDSVLISPDVATCDDCLVELSDVEDRRFQYPFLNCTNCGPRLTIVTSAPYDRSRTTMSKFVLCEACRAEYQDPANRRFYAQPTACPWCGPQLRMLDAAGDGIIDDDPLSSFATQLTAGCIGAMKGIGGYHLVCDATNANTVAELRRRKRRNEKPFAVMVENLAAAEVLCEINDAEQELLTSCRSPIVLLRRRSQATIADGVALGNPRLGVMLPYSPMHHLLLRRINTPLVMTSGNRADEPIAVSEADALHQLRGIADSFLVHNRPIHVRCDDSVTRVVAGQKLPIRRSRGYAPQPISLPLTCPHPILAVGGQLKGTFALGRGDAAILSHHVGDLDHFAAYRAFERDIEVYQQLFAIAPQCIAHDMHPDYASTRYALTREGVTTLAVQHHHAHMAACMAEHRLAGPTIGVTFDGTGYGNDGAIWGGEFLVGDYAHVERFAHLRYVGLPGGESAVREPWRMAISHLLDAGCAPGFISEIASPTERRTVETMLRRGLNSPKTSSMGRFFDAVAALIGVRRRVSYEGQAAIELEWLASDIANQSPYPYGIDNATTPAVIDTRPLICAVVDDIRRGTERGVIARRFHETVVEMIVAICETIRNHQGWHRVVLSGGVFANALLTEEAVRRLNDEQFDVYRHRLVPPNDGGLSLGQLAVAAATLRQRAKEASREGGSHVPRHTR